MKKLTKKDQAILNRLMRDYNSYSHLVAVNYHRHHEEGTLEWNRGSLNIIRNYLEEFANSRGGRTDLHLWSSFPSGYQTRICYCLYEEVKNKAPGSRVLGVFLCVQLWYNGVIKGVKNYEEV